MLQWLYMYVASFCSQCFIYLFRRMLQVCLSAYCIYFTHMFACVLCGYCVCFCNGFKCFSDVFYKCFRCMFQVFYLPSDVCCKYCIWMCSKVDRVLHLPPRLLLSRLGVSSSSRHWLGIRRFLPPFSMLVTFRARVDPMYNKNFINNEIWKYCWAVNVVKIIYEGIK
jgi:hypothetical protein